MLFRSKFGLVKLDTDTTKTNLLGGSVFTLTGKFAGGTTVETKTLNPTAVDGAELRAQLVASTNDTDETHTYTLTETVPPEGYKITAAPVTIRIAREGTIQYKNNGTWTDDNSSPFLFIRDELNSFGLNKTDANGTTRLTGATYTVTGKFAGDTASTSKTLTSDASSTPQLKGVLVAGSTYTIAETVPAPGYIISPLSDSYKDAVLDGGAMTIRMDASGVLSYLSGDDKWTTVNENTLLFKDALTSIDLEKTGTENSKKMLNGSEYKIGRAHV